MDGSRAAPAFWPLICPKGGSEILDVGAGTGLVGVALRELGFSRVYAFDLSPEMLEHALEKAVYRQIRLGNAERMEGIASDAFDAVICVGSLNFGHISPAAFTQFIRVTRPGGLIAFTTREDYYRDAARPAREALVAAGRWLLVEEREVENAVKDMPHRHFCYRCA